MELEYQSINIASEDLVKHLVFSQQIDAHLRRTTVDLEIPGLADQENISVTDEEVQSVADGYRKSLGLYDSEETQKFLDRFDLSIEDFSDYCERRALEKKIKQEYFSADDVEEFFVNNRSEFDRVQISIIDVNREPMANELKMQVEEEGKDFHDLAREYSNHPSRYKGGSIGLVGREQVDDTLEGKIFNTDVGEIVGPVQKSNQYRLILIEDFIEPELDQELEEVIRNRLFNQWMQDRLS